VPTPTADLCDAHPDAVRVLAPEFRDYGGAAAFAGQVSTLRLRGDNALVRTTLSEPGRGRVLVIDGGRLLTSALVGGRLGALAAEHGWSGVIVWGAVRDAAELALTPVGIKAVATCPVPPRKSGAGERDVPVDVAGVTITPGDWLSADADGIVVASRDLTCPD